MSQKSIKKPATGKTLNVKIVNNVDNDKLTR